MEKVEILMLILTPILSGLFAVLASQGFWAYMSKKDTKKSAQRKIIEGMAHDVIIERCKEYMERGYIYSDELSDLRKYYYEPYRELGGNGTAEKAYNDVLNLPMRFRQ